MPHPQTKKLLKWIVSNEILGIQITLYPKVIDKSLKFHTNPDVDIRHFDLGFIDKLIT